MIIDDERYLFDLNGYLIIENALSQGELDDLNGIINSMPSWEERAGTRHAHTGMDEEHVRNTPSDPALGLVNYYSSLLLDWGEPFRKLVGHANILPYLTEFLGETARLDHQYAIFQKRMDSIAGTLSLHGGGTPYGASEYYQFRNGRFYNGLMVFSFALTDAPPGSGGFGCLPGSHKSNLPLPSRFRDLADPIASVAEVPVKAGDVIVFTEALSHGTLSWKAAHERRMLLYKYCPGHMQYERGSPYASLDYDWTPIQRSLLRPPYVGGREPILES
jgi:ectoine hydroxylase-related dioxygenase (phytanoyl-CoA dioxygenase family)